MSDTPRTDMLLIVHDIDPKPGTIVEHARQLERELSASNERIRRMEEAGDEMAWCLGEQNHFVSAWRKAKEAKP